MTSSTKPPTTPARPPAPAWVPIRSLTSRHRARIAEHLMQLSVDDRYLRFGYIASDAQIARYVESLDFARDEVFGIFNRRLQLIAAAHLAYAPPKAEARAMAEFGVSVLAKARGRGYGGHLFHHAMLHARNRGIDTLMIHALTENAVMLRIVRKAGAKVQRTGAESQALLKLPALSLISRMEQLVGDQAAEIDYEIKRRTRRTASRDGSADAGDPPVPGDATEPRHK